MFLLWDVLWAKEGVVFVWYPRFYQNSHTTSVAKIYFSYIIEIGSNLAETNSGAYSFRNILQNWKGYLELSKTEDRSVPEASTSTEKFTISTKG